MDRVRLTSASSTHVVLDANRWICDPASFPILHAMFHFSEESHALGEEVDCTCCHGHKSGAVALLRWFLRIQPDRNRWPLVLPSSFAAWSCNASRSRHGLHLLHCIGCVPSSLSFASRDPVSMGFLLRVHSFPLPREYFLHRGDPTCVPTGWEDDAHPQSQPQVVVG